MENIEYNLKDKDENIVRNSTRQYLVKSSLSKLTNYPAPFTLYKHPIHIVQITCGTVDKYYHFYTTLSAEREKGRHSGTVVE